MELLDLQPPDYGVRSTGIYIIDDDGLRVFAGHSSPKPPPLPGSFNVRRRWRLLCQIHAAVQESDSGEVSPHRVQSGKSHESRAMKARPRLASAAASLRSVARSPLPQPPLRCSAGPPEPPGPARTANGRRDRPTCPWRAPAALLAACSRAAGFSKSYARPR
jgi:hypothetical protein